MLSMRFGYGRPAAFAAARALALASGDSGVDLAFGLARFQGGRFPGVFFVGICNLRFCCAA